MRKAKGHKSEEMRRESGKGLGGTKQGCGKTAWRTKERRRRYGKRSEGKNTESGENPKITCMSEVKK